MKAYKDEGVTSINFNIIDIETKNENSKERIEENLLNYKPVFPDMVANYINSDAEFKSCIYSILNNFYLGIGITKNVLHLITEKGNYYVIYMDKVSLENVKIIFNHNFTKKVFFNEYKIGKNLLVDSANMVDLKFIMKILFLEDFDSDEEMFLYLGAEGFKSMGVRIYNFIEIAKKINIYIEKKKLNKYLHLENDIKDILINSSRKGFPINKKEYEKYIANLKIGYEEIKAEGLDLKNKDRLLEDLNKRNKYLSLYPDILRTEDYELYKKLKIYNSFNDYKLHSHTCDGNGLFHARYDTYSLNVFGIEGIIIPSSFYYNSEDLDIIEGSYKDIYFKIFAELSRDGNLISEASKGTLLNYISKEIGVFKENKNDNSILVTSMFLNAYANGIYDKKGVTNYLYHRWDTYFSSNDVENMNRLFNEKMTGLMSFFKTFDGNSGEFSRYNTKIFHPGLSLHKFILQIENLVYKTAIKYINGAIKDYNDKHKKDAIYIGGVFNKKIVLVSENEHSDIAIDILNRYMAVAYRRYIKNTKYLNVTEIKKR